MSDQDVGAALDRLERLLGTPIEFPNAKAINDWHDSFKAAVATAERGPHWPELLVRARLLGRLMKRREALIQAGQDRLKRKLHDLTSGRRALNAYKAPAFL